MGSAPSQHANDEARTDLKEIDTTVSEFKVVPLTQYDSPLKIVQYPQLPHIPEEQRVTVIYAPPKKPETIDVTNEFCTYATSYYKWKRDNTMYMSDIEIICYHARVTDKEASGVVVGLIDKMNNYIPNAVVFKTKPPEFFKSTVSYPMYEVGNYLYFGDANKETSTWFKIRPGFIGSGFSLESIEKPLYFVRVTGNRVVLTRRRLLYGETIQEWQLSATFSFEDGKIINGLTKQFLIASTNPTSKNNFPLISSKVNANLREEVCIFSMNQVEVPIRQRCTADRIYLVNGSDANSVIVCNGNELFIENGSDGIMLRIIKDTNKHSIRFESVTRPGYFISYEHYRLALKREGNNTFFVKQGFLGENTFLFQCSCEGFEKLFLQAEDTYWNNTKKQLRLLLSEINPQQESSRRNATFSVKRIPE